MADDGPHWETLDAEAGSVQRVQSRWVASDISWPETAASIAIAPDRSAVLHFTHLDLANGERSRYGSWQNHWVVFGIGQREQAFVARQPTDGRKVLRLGRGAGAFIAQALTDGAADNLVVELEYRKQGQTAFSFPLRGAAHALHQIGLVDASDEQAAASATAVDASVAATETSAPPATPRSGEAIYNRFCFACHATAVAAAPLFGSLEQWQPRIDKGLDTLVAASLAGFDGMPPMGTCMDCTDSEMRDAIQYMIDNAR